MLGFETYCPTCGIDVEKENGVKRFGKYFCSLEHAQDYAKLRFENDKKQEEEYDSRSRHSFGGCCG